MRFACSRRSSCTTWCSARARRCNTACRGRSCTGCRSCRRRVAPCLPWSCRCRGRGRARRPVRCRRGLPARRRPAASPRAYRRRPPARTAPSSCRCIRGDSPASNPRSLSCTRPRGNTRPSNRCCSGTVLRRSRSSQQRSTPGPHRRRRTSRTIEASRAILTAVQPRGHGGIERSNVTDVDRYPRPPTCGLASRSPLRSRLTLAPASFAMETHVVLSGVRRDLPRVSP